MVLRCKSRYVFALQIRHCARPEWLRFNLKPSASLYDYGSKWTGGGERLSSTYKCAWNNNNGQMIFANEFTAHHTVIFSIDTNGIYCPIQIWRQVWLSVCLRFSVRLSVCVITIIGIIKPIMNGSILAAFLQAIFLVKISFTHRMI